MKIGKNSQMGLLAQNGINIPIEKTFNPLEFYNPNKQKYVDIWQNYDLNQNVSRFTWSNLPNGLTSWNLEKMLYFRGSLCGFVFGGQFYILPYVINGQINAYGMPTSVTPISFNGRAVGKNDTDFFGKKFKLSVDIGGNEINDYTAVLLFDSCPQNSATSPQSRYFLNSIVINDIADCMARVNINVVVSNKKIFLVIKDTAQKTVVEKELRSAFSSDCPFVLLSSELDIQTIQSTNDFNADDLFNTIKNYDAVRCFMSGILSKNFGGDKKERLIVGELDGNDEQVKLIADLGLQFRKEFCEKCNKKFNLNMQVELKHDSYYDEDKEIEEEKIIEVEGKENVE